MGRHTFSAAVNRLRRGTGQWVAVGLLVGALSLPIFGFGSSPGGPIGREIASLTRHGAVTQVGAVGNQPTGTGMTLTGPLRHYAAVTFLPVRDISGESQTHSHASQIDIV